MPEHVLNSPEEMEPTEVIKAWEHGIHFVCPCGRNQFKIADIGTELVAKCLNCNQINSVERF